MQDGRVIVRKNNGTKVEKINMWFNKEPIVERNIRVNLRKEVKQKGYKRISESKHTPFGVEWKSWKERRVVEVEMENRRFYVVEVTASEAHDLQKNGVKVFVDENFKEEVKIKRYNSGHYSNEGPFYALVTKNDFSRYLFEGVKFYPIASP